MQLDYFYSLTPRQFDNILTGYRNKQESSYRTSWIQTRHIMYMVALPNLPKGKKLTEHDLLPFEWEQKEVVIKDEAQLQKRAEFWDKVTEQHFDKKED